VESLSNAIALAESLHGNDGLQPRFQCPRQTVQRAGVQLLYQSQEAGQYGLHPSGIQRKIYSTRDDAKTEIFKFIGMLYNPIKHIVTLEVLLQRSLKKTIFPG